jgi:DNA sulfur modification protein DndD
VLNSFLKELLDSGSCICKRYLAEGSPERAAVETLLTIAGDQDFNNAVGALDHAMGLIEGVARQTEDQLKQLNTERLELARTSATSMRKSRRSINSSAARRTRKSSNWKMPASG